MCKCPATVYPSSYTESCLGKYNQRSQPASTGSTTQLSCQQLHSYTDIWITVCPADARQWEPSGVSFLRGNNLPLMTFEINLLIGASRHRKAMSQIVLRQYTNAIIGHHPLALHRILPSSCWWQLCTEVFPVCGAFNWSLFSHHLPSVGQ